MTQIVTVADTDSSATRAQPHPVLEAGNVSFPNGRYAVEFSPHKGGPCCTLKHGIEYASLIRRLLDEGAARYCCTVSSPVSSYRGIHFSEHASQEIAWNPADMGEPPLFTPMVIASESRTVQLCSDRDDVHRIWNGQTVEIKTGCRLAVGPVVRIKPTLLHLLRFNQDMELAPGRFRVAAESQPFQFVVALSADLHRFLRYGKEDAIWRHIMTHVVTACFALLQRDFSTIDGDEMDGGDDRNLEALEDFLEQRELPHWEDEDFRPEEVATALYPHLVDDGKRGG